MVRPNAIGHERSYRVKVGIWFLLLEPCFAGMEMENEDTRNQEVHEGRQRNSRRKRKLEAEDKKSGLNRKAETYHWTNLLTKLGPGLHRVTKRQNTLRDAGRRP